MRRPRRLQAFTPEQFQTAHELLATRVAYMMGRKLEEGDWAEVYCRAKGIPLQGWSNLNIDIMHGHLGVEHKMMCYRSRVDLQDACGRPHMHPALTRSIRVPPAGTDPDVAMQEVLRQYADLVEARRQKLRERAGVQEPDLRTGWLLWQESLRQFLYFEEEMLAPDPSDYFAKWMKSGGGARKESSNLWVFEKETGHKRYSITTDAGAKIQPYFDVPPLGDPSLYFFEVIGEVIKPGLVRMWVTEATVRELQRLLGSLDTEKISEAILKVSVAISEAGVVEEAETQVAQPVLVTESAYRALREALPGVSDEHSLQLLAQYLRRE